jgi:hypothetical protein
MKGFSLADLRECKWMAVTTVPLLVERSSLEFTAADDHENAKTNPLPEVIDIMSLAESS